MCVTPGGGIISVLYTAGGGKMPVCWKTAVALLLLFVEVDFITTFDDEDDNEEAVVTDADDVCCTLDKLLRPFDDVPLDSFLPNILAELLLDGKQINGI